jgi:2-dehydropantoate 2-reductase
MQKRQFQRKNVSYKTKKLLKEEKMKILFYGAGVIGSLYAARLKESGQDVSILARGQRLADIRQHGIVLEDVSTGNRTTTRVNVVEQLNPEDAYDLVVVMMPKNHVPEILPTLAANRHTPNVLFMVNNAAGPDEMINALSRERVLLGFPGAGGIRKGNVVRYRVVSARQQPTTFGELDGSASARLEKIVDVFKGAGFPVAISSQMDAWLKTHVAEVSPMANALYMAGGDNYRLARTRDAIVLMIRSMREGYSVLEELNIPIVPARHKILKWIPEPMLVALMRRIFKSDEMADLIGHAHAARDEMKQICDEFKVLARSTSVPTPAMNRLFIYTDPDTQPVADGSTRIVMSWRGVGIVLSALVVLIVVLIIL